MNQKLINLETRLRQLPSVAVAFSGGVDSSFLLAAAKKINPKRLLAVTVSSCFVPQREIAFARKIAGSLGVEQICLEVNILENLKVVKNTRERCYHCKLAMFSLIKAKARDLGIATLVHGVNLDDLKDFRPGLKAAEELGFHSPLADEGLTKSDIRRLSRQLGLETWDKPSQSCLATRIPCNEKITQEALVRIDAAESFLQDLGFAKVRVRCHKRIARIEVEPDQVPSVSTIEMSKKILPAFARMGFEQTHIDMDGYKTGKMNHEILPGQPGKDICHPA